MSIAKGELLVDVSPLNISSTSVNNTSTTTTSIGGPDPNVRTGWKKRILAGPNHIGAATMITASIASSNSSGPAAGVLIQDSVTHIDVDVAIL